MPAHFIHGYTHAPDGTDPIPVTATGGFVAPSVPIDLHSGNIAAYSAAGSSSIGSPGNVSSKPSSGFSLASVDGDAANGYHFSTSSDLSTIILGAPLGPVGSIWGVGMDIGPGNDVGKLDLEWGTTLIDPDVTLGDALWPTTWHNKSTVDPYFAGFAVGSKSVGNLYGSIAPIRIAGGGDADGLLTADGTDNAQILSESGFSVPDMEAGGDGRVVWWLRVQVNGKNASSSATKARIFAIHVHRLLYKNTGTPLLYRLT